MMTFANDMMIVQMSKTAVICAGSFLSIKVVVDFQWKGHLKIAKLSVLPQPNCCFVCPGLLAKVSQFLFCSFKHKVRQVC
jgi:hypothetical protein